MKMSHVILANEPRLLRGMLKRVLNRTPELKVVGEVTDQALIRSLVEETDVQWVIVPLWSERGAPHAIRDLLTEHPTVSVMGMAPDGSRAKIKRAGRPEQILPGLSLDELVNALCAQAAHKP
jgi:DNA-binding NarL/FixJ family response regulator